MAGGVRAITGGRVGSPSANPVLELHVSHYGRMSEPLLRAEVDRPVSVEAGTGISMVRARSMAFSIVRGW